MAENKKKQVRMYDHDFEVFVSEKDFISGKYRVTANYLGYPLIGIDYGYTEEEAIDNTVRKILETNSLDSVKVLYD